MDEYALEDLEELIEGYEGLEHIRVKRRGKSLTLLSGEGADEQTLARLTWLRGDMWGLSMPRHTGRWEKTPYTGTMADLLGLLTEMFLMFLRHW